MVLATARGVPEAGLTFAGAMLLGVASTLTLVALAAVLLRQAVSTLLERHGSSVVSISRVLDGCAGLILLVIAAF
jgi:nickel/cobalt exporter